MKSNNVNKKIKSNGKNEKFKTNKKNKKSKNSKSASRRTRRSRATRRTRKSKTTSEMITRSIKLKEEKQEVLNCTKKSPAILQVESYLSLIRLDRFSCLTDHKVYSVCRPGIGLRIRKGIARDYDIDKGGIRPGLAGG